MNAYNYTVESHQGGAAHLQIAPEPELDGCFASKLEVSQAELLAALTKLHQQLECKKSRDQTSLSETKSRCHDKIWCMSSAYLPSYLNHVLDVKEIQPSKQYSGFTEESDHVFPSCGLSYTTIQHLLWSGAKVYMATRNREKAQEAIKSLKKDKSWKDKGGEVVWLRLNSSDPREAKKAVKEFLSKEKRLDVLSFCDPISVLAVNNATLLFDTPFEKTVDVTYMLPLQGTKFKEIDNLCVKYKRSFMAGFLCYSGYGHSKLLEVLWSKNLQKHLDASSPPVPITVIAVHPGFIDTFTHNWPLSFIWSMIACLVIKNAKEGSYMSVFTAASKTVEEAREKYKGAYLVPVGKIAKTSAIGGDPEKAEELYQLMLKFLKGIGL
ncbi:short chain dehydrogenase [Moniliophthora roreri]|nr:short chain dehydrogenase [Moniliophthora roreri]